MNKKNKKLLVKMNNEKRRSSLEKIKRKKRRETLFIVTLFLIVIVVFGLLFSNYLKLKTIEVEGNNQITKEEILEAGNINNNLRTWSIKDEIQNNIKSRFEIFKSVTVKSTLPSSIKVYVEEYSFIAQIKKDDGNTEIIMENGKSYSGKIRNNYNLPILENFNNDGNKLEEVYKNLNKLKQEVRLQISEIIDDESDRVIIYMKDGQKVKALRANFADKLNYYEEISKYIEDKNNTTLNLINGAYLETLKTEKTRNDNIKKLLSRQGLTDDDSSNKDKNNVEKEDKVQQNNKSENSTTNKKNSNLANNKNIKQQSSSNKKDE